MKTQAELIERRNEAETAVRMVLATVGVTTVAQLVEAEYELLRESMRTTPSDDLALDQARLQCLYALHKKLVPGTPMPRFTRTGGYSA